MLIKIFYFIFSVILIIFFCFLKIFKKKTFISKINNTRIGHFLIETELHILEKEFKKKKNQISFYFFSPYEKSCNIALENIVKRKFKILPSLLGKYIIRVNNFFFLKTKFNIISSYQFYTNDKYLLLNKSHTQLCFSNEEIEYGEKIINKLGLKNKKFVCIINRDSSYLKKRIHKDYSHHSYRNSSIKNYIEASNFLAQNNIVPVRLGSITSEKIDKKYDHIFDYSNSNYRSDFLDLYLPSRCFFWISGDTGLAITAKIYRKPIVTVNRAPFFQPNWSGISKSTNITIFKKYYDNVDKKFLSINEIRKKNVGFFQRSEEFQKSNIDLHENSSDEIFFATEQMYQTLENKFKKNDVYKELEKRFWEAYGNNDYKNQKHISDICYKYLIKNSYLLN